METAPLPLRPVFPQYFVAILAIALLAATFSMPPVSAQSIMMTPTVRQPTLSKNISVDEFSGKTVTTSEMAYKMIRLRHLNAPKVNEMAPDFHLYSLDRKKEVTLKELAQDKPVALIFGSWGCDIFREAQGGLMDLYFETKKHVNWVMVYTREIHPSDGFAGDLGRVPDPKSDLERRSVAEICRKQLRIPFEVIVDGINDPVATRWGGMPVRAFVIDQRGTVIYAGSQGPWGFRPYEGFQHGSGQQQQNDFEYNWDTLESFLKTRFK